MSCHPFGITSDAEQAQHTFGKERTISTHWGYALTILRSEVVISIVSPEKNLGKLLMKNLKLNSTAQSFDSHSEFIILKKNFSSFNANPTPIPSTTTPTGKI